MDQENGLHKPVATGSFQSGKLVDLLKGIKKDALTGELSISSHDGDGFLAIYKGYITTVFSPGMYETLKHNLEESGLLKEDQIKELVEIQKTTPNDLLESRLIKEGHLSKESFCRILKTSCELALKDMFSWSGLYRLYEDSYSEVPEEILIDIEKIEKEKEGISRRYGKRATTDMSYGNLFASVLKTVGGEKNLANKKLKKTLDNVAKKLDSFKPREVVVIVDEDPVTSSGMSNGLSGYGFEVERFDNAKAALERVLELENQRIPVVVVTDLQMKGLRDENEKFGGNDILQDIKDNYPHVPIIVVSSIRDNEIKLKSLFLGASYFLPKPEKGLLVKDAWESHLNSFVEELSYYIWNVLRGRRYFIEKEEISSGEDEIIDCLLESSSVSLSEKENLFSAKILIADDELNIRTALKEYLEEDGFQSIDTAEDGEKAIECFKKERHDVIIVDIVMPIKDGIEVLKEIKTRSPNSQVIIITGNADKNSAISAVRFGAFDYIEKPFDLGILARAVLKAVDKKLLLDKRTA